MNFSHQTSCISQHRRLANVPLNLFSHIINCWWASLNELFNFQLSSAIVSTAMELHRISHFSVPSKHISGFSVVVVEETQILFLKHKNVLSAWYLDKIRLVSI